MPIVHRNPHNRKMKSFLKKHKITYQMIAEKSNYSYWSIADWMLHPMTDRRKAILIAAINQVIMDRKRR